LTYMDVADWEGTHFWSYFPVGGDWTGAQTQGRPAILVKILQSRIVSVAIVLI